MCTLICVQGIRKYFITSHLVTPHDIFSVIKLKPVFPENGIKVL